MTLGFALAIVLAVAVGFAGGMAVGLARGRARLRRVAEGVAQLAGGNHAHRVILPGDDAAAAIAADLNRLADAIQLEQETSATRDEARRRLLADVSHDLRTPITSIAGYVDALSRRLGDEPERYLAIIAAKSDELAQLTDDLFYASRLDAGDLKLDVGPLDLAEAVRRSVLGFEPQLSGAGVRVDVAIPEGPCMVDADKSAVSRVLSNLVSNGIRHGVGTTAMSVRMTGDDSSWLRSSPRHRPPLRAGRRRTGRRHRPRPVHRPGARRADGSDRRGPCRRPRLGHLRPRLPEGAVHCGLLSSAKRKGRASAPSCGSLTLGARGRRPAWATRAHTRP
jgi:signal transduction histidine kinase